MTRTITLALRADDAEPILREVAYEAAKYSAQCDYITSRTYHSPQPSGLSFADWQKRTQDRFLRAKRLVESFGVEYEQTSEPETMTVAYDYVGGKTKVIKVPGVGPVGWRTGSEPDYKHPRPSYRGEVHSHACHAAADRVVRAWQAILNERLAA